jgi:cbb3-type cytochrome c oxidase subunit III
VRRPAAVSVLVVATALLAAGCGTGGIAKGGDASAGKPIFQAKCGGCHTLADAGTHGQTGPDLDDAFGPDRKQGFKQVTIEQVVRDQIELAVPPMPQNLVTGADADAVAAYVAQVAGTGVTAAKNSTNGKDIFTANCGSCHTLADAGTNGKVGPVLDQAKPALSLAVLRLTHGQGAMPNFTGTLTKKQIADVAAYVVKASGGNPNG